MTTFVPWAIAPHFVIGYGPLRRIWLGIMGHGTGLGSALWAVAQDLVVRWAIA
jgi:hypothetical protein